MKLLAKLIEVVTFSVGVLLGLRILLEFLGANIETPFVGWLYDLTSTFIAPFANIFPSPQFGNRGIIDVPALFALGLYLALGFFLSELSKAADKYLKGQGMFKSKKKPFTKIQ